VIFDLLMKLHLMGDLLMKLHLTGGGYISLSNIVMLMAMKKTEMCRRRPRIEESALSVTRKRLLVVIHICEIIFLSDYIPLKARNMLLQHAATRHYGKGCSSSLSRNCLPSPDCQTLKHASTCHML